ncbi:sensor histidine kinase [Pontibacter ramchanderi]|uniref:histidine kinase n=1 Tax=Pontibacter ramchanderi TaxID=1179743 RepID=A0A2N3V1I0_9BACT|nr:PAS domain-containing sensor histidine kinase [Pontibacter ramchanderi]PKV75477.1 PAS domain S-box-containing protein [Pontibacter ramchanderi]
MDISKELELYQFEKLNEALFLHHPDAIFLLDLQGKFRMVNEKVCEITGYTRGQLIGASFDLLMEASMKAHTWARFRETTQDKPQRYETAVLTKEGVRHLDVTNFPLKNDSRVLAVFGIAKDITAKKQKEMELERYATLLENHNDELEIFRKILAHDMRKPVANALGFARLLQGTLNESKEKEIKHYLLHTVEFVDVMLRDLNELIALQSAGHMSKEVVDVGKVLKRTVNFFQEEIRQTGTTVAWHVAENTRICTIKAYLQSIIRNLISNALKYRSTERKPTIEVVAQLQKDVLIIQVTDNGIGMDLHAMGQELFQMHRRFAPKAAEGNGLGLYIVKQQVKLLGGQITVKSEIDKGSTFTITLPDKES